MNITGNNSNETLNGTVDDDIIKGLGGNDILNGLDGNDVLDGGNGKDILNGGTGDNLFIGGGGNDTYVLTGRFESVEFGRGTDLVDLSGFSGGDGFLSLNPNATVFGLFVLIDGEEDFGVIRADNGLQAEGLVYFQNLNNALQLVDSKPEGGVGISGTANADVFNVDMGEKGWIQIRPGEGADTIQIQGDGGFVRLDYSDQTDGIFANLKFGFVIDGSDGFVVDQITGDGRVWELRGSDHDDTIYGSKFDESFILRQGDDFVSAGGGTDRIRYDRSGVESVTVDLSKGTATGTWNGEAFTHTLKGIEDIRGSRDGKDKLVGNGKDNVIDGKGGNDVLQGRGGDDTLIGGSGADKFVFRNNDGNDFIVDFNTKNNTEKINLKAVSAITSFADLMAQHITEFDNGTIRQTYIDDGAGLNITLDKVLIADLDSGDFIF